MTSRILAFILLGCLNAVWNPVSLHAEVVSIVNSGRDQSAKQVETHLKANLRDEGFQVKGGTTDGYVVLLNSTQIQAGGEIIGVSGSVVIGSLDWVNLANSLIPRECDAEIVSQVKNYIGLELVFIDSKLEIAGSEKELAMQLATVVNDAVRTGSKKIDVLMREIKRAETEKTDRGQLRGRRGYGYETVR